MDTLDKYLSENISHTVMISLSIDDSEPFQYNHWNWLRQYNQLHLLKDDYSIGHIIHSGLIKHNEDGSISFTSEYYPKNCILNFYFGSVRN